MCPAGAPCNMGCLVVADERQLQCVTMQETPPASQPSRVHAFAACPLRADSPHFEFISGMTPGI